MTDAELRRHFKNHRYDFAQTPERLSELFQLVTGKLSMEESKESFLDTFDARLTFRESFEHTGRHINISVSPTEKYQSARLLNAFTAPDVTLRSAISASCALPGLAPSVQLETKDSRGKLKPYLPGRFWVDGSMSDDLPFKRVSRIYGVNHFLVSLINPFALPLIPSSNISDRGSLFSSAQTLTLAAVNEGLKSARRWTYPIAPRKSDFIFGGIHQILKQQYLGDINFVLKPRHVRPLSVMFSYSGEQEIDKLILEGERSVWENVSRIENAVKIGNTIKQMLALLLEA